MRFRYFHFYSFDNDDMKSSKRHVILLSLIFLLKCFSKSFLIRFALIMQIYHQNLANVFFPDGAHFFCPDLFYHVIKQESETGKCNMR